MSDPVFVAVTMDSGEPLRVMQFLTRGRGTHLPAGAQWVDDNADSGWWTREATPENIASEVKRSCPLNGLDGAQLPQPISHRVIDQSEVPTDRTFRDALADDGKRLHHDMPKAREIHRRRIRQERAIHFSKLDVDYQRADESGDKAAKVVIADQKQTLRDAPQNPAIDAAKTTDDLKVIWPFNGEK